MYKFVIGVGLSPFLQAAQTDNLEMLQALLDRPSVRMIDDQDLHRAG